MTSTDVTIGNTTYFIEYEIFDSGLEIAYMAECIGDGETREIKPQEALFDVVKRHAEYQLREDIESERETEKDGIEYNLADNRNDERKIFKQ